MIVTNATKNIINKVIEIVNNEFILNRGKHLHITERYPNLFNEDNFSNIFLLNERGLEFDSVMVVKTIDINLNNKILKSFFVGSQVTVKQARGKGYGKYLFEFVSKHYISKGFDIGVGWTRLQEYYLKTGWHAFENGIFVECYKLKHNLFNEYNNPVSISIVRDYKRLENYRISKLENYIIRNTNNSIEGYGTIYTPGEESFCYQLCTKGEIEGYIYGVKSPNLTIIYEYAVDEIFHLYRLLNYLVNEKAASNIAINLSIYDGHLSDILSFFETVGVNKPNLTIYKPSSLKVFNEMKYFYIPFTDRI